VAPPNNKLLIVEDDPGLQSQLKWCFDERELFLASDRNAALELMKREKPTVVITDLGLPPDPGGSSEGFALINDLLNLDEQIKIIVVTGREERENAVKAIGLGAYDFYQKPIDVDTLKFVVNRAFRLRELEIENDKLYSSQLVSSPEGMVGVSAKLLQVLKTADKVSPTSANLLILGESGTGKGMLAKRIHSSSDRVEKKLVTINCTSIPESLLESELFGHEKGAFTGAIAKKIGKIEYADGGTLFLDEIGDMPLALQAKILHVLQEKTIVRLGGVEEIPLDVRVICATHQDLKSQISKGLFREDLFYRISEIVMELPALRARAEDIPVISQAFLNRYSAQMNRKGYKFSQDALLAIKSYRWPGNIRELENKIKRAVVMCEKSLIGVDDLELSLGDVDSKIELLSDVREQAETAAILKALTFSKNISDAAKNLGITRPTLYSLIDKYQLEPHITANQLKSLSAEGE
jgi:two-component system, NtrC family, response regulator